MNVRGQATVRLADRRAGRSPRPDLYAALSRLSRGCPGCVVPARRWTARDFAALSQRLEHVFVFRGSTEVVTLGGVRNMNHVRI